MDWTIAILSLVLVVEALVIAYFFFQRKDKLKAIEKLNTALSEAGTREEQLRQAEEEALMRESWIRTLFNHTKDMVFVFELDDEGMPGLFLDANEDACLRMGHTREEFQAMTLLDVEAFDMQFSTGYSKSDLVMLSDNYIKERYDKLAKREAQQMMEELLEKGRLLVERIFQDKNGKKIPAEMYLQLFDLGSKPLVMCTVKDVSDRKEAAMALSESRQRFRDFFTHAPIGIAIYDAQRELIDVNGACLKMFGVPDRDAFARFNIFANPYLQQDTRKTLDRGESVRDELVIDFSDAVRQAVIVSARTGKAHFDMIMNNMGLGRDFRPRGYFALIQDITDKRVAEEALKKQAEKLLQAEKMEAIGAMAGGIAHDFNNILTPIVGYVKMILRASKEGEPINKFAAGIEKASLRAKDLVAQILTFARKADTQEDTNLKPIRVIPIAKEVMNMQRQAQPKEVEVNRVIKTEQDVVVIDPTKLHQVLMNLCTNAGHAMRATNGGTLEMMITDFIVDPRAKTDYPELKPGQRYIKISVRDTGSGMDKATLSKIFEPFFTTKKKGEGTGMGLSVVQGIMKSAKGALRVESELGKGSVFHVILPVVDEKLLQQQAEDTNKEMPLGTESILLVDDELDVLEVLGHMMTALGYRPVGASSATEALNLFLANPAQFDAILTDQVMPGMSGTELARQVQAIRPDLPIVMITAFSENLLPEELEQLGIRKVINKPILLSDLAESMRAVLDKPATPRPIIPGAPQPTVRLNPAQAFRPPAPTIRG